MTHLIKTPPRSMKDSGAVRLGNGGMSPAARKALTAATRKDR
ncbi:hypothetical protein [Pseudooctadecabacter sp.]|nr:hypothetical protein [Pseudooctadecabacter sp.]